MMFAILALFADDVTGPVTVGKMPSELCSEVVQYMTFDAVCITELPLAPSTSIIPKPRPKDLKK